MRINLLGALAIAGLICGACGEGLDLDSPIGFLENDRDFIRRASTVSRAEIEMGDLAVKQAMDTAVQNFAKHMVLEHRTALRELEVIVGPDHEDFVAVSDENNQQTMQILRELSGYTFDTTYMRTQVRNHLAAITVYQSQIRSGSDKRLRQHAEKFLPRTEKNLAKADSIVKGISQ